MHDNVLINHNMLEASTRNKVKRFLYSSMPAFTPNYKQTMPEWQPKGRGCLSRRSKRAYGWEKLFTEEMVKAYHIDYGLDIRITRYPIYMVRGNL